MSNSMLAPGVYRKKNTITARQFFHVKTPWPVGVCIKHCLDGDLEKPHVHTIHNNQSVIIEDGDWIIPEPDGEHHYPCKADIFEANYERVPTLQSTGDNVPSGKTLPQIEEQLREAFKEGHRCGADACYNYLEMKEEHRIDRGHPKPISFVEWEEKDWLNFFSERVKTYDEITKHAEITSAGGNLQKQ